MSIKEYVPSGYKRYAHPAASDMADLVDATDDLAVPGGSDDGYDNYTTRPHVRGCNL
jgi:hypothetical protein